MLFFIFFGLKMIKKLPKLRAHIEWCEGFDRESGIYEILEISFYDNIDFIIVLMIDPDDGLKEHVGISLDDPYSEVTILWDEFFKQLTAVGSSSVDSQPVTVDAASSEHSE